MNCEGRLFYPGTPEAIGGPDIPISSLRMKAIRETIDDYEYLYLLAKSGREKEADEIVESLYTLDPSRAKAMRKPTAIGSQHNPQWWEADPDAMMSARLKIATILQKTP